MRKDERSALPWIASQRWPSLQDQSGIFHLVLERRRPEVREGGRVHTSAGLSQRDIVLFAFTLDVM